MQFTPNSDNIFLGSGDLFFDRFKDGQKTGEIHFGNVTAFNVSTTDETKKLFESMTKNRGLYKEVTTQRTVTANVTGNEFNIENVALALMGSEGAIDQAAGVIADQTLTASAKHGRYYPVGKRNISAVVVKEGATTFVEGTDYQVDAASGRVKVLATGSITEGSTLTVSCSYAMTKLKVIEGANAGTIEGSLRFVGDPTAGPAVEVEVFRVKVNPSGELGFISEEFGAWSLTCSVLADQSRPAGESPYFRVIYL